MSCRRLAFLTSFAFWAVIAPAFAADDQAPSREQVGRSIERSLPYLEREGVAWIDNHNCISCHHVPFMLWSHNAAKSAGIAVDEAKLAQWNEWTAAKSLSMRGPTKVPGETDGGGLDTLAQLLLGRSHTERGLMVEFVTQAPQLMVAWQQPGGQWKAAGQLPNLNRPLAETDAVTTKWAVLALATLDKPPPQVAKGLERALPSVKEVGAGKSTESLITAILIARRFAQQEQLPARLAELLRIQNADGGWSWALGGRSDAFATGQALYALGQIDAPQATPSIDRARKYLIETQQEDGSWPVTGEGISNAATPQRKKKVEPIYRYWGTAWATIGLCSSTPRKK